jgi:hypothetical protein
MPAALLAFVKISRIVWTGVDCCFFFSGISYIWGGEKKSMDKTVDW